MPRPAAPHKKVRFHVTLTQETYGRIVLQLADPLAERGVPLGSFSAFFEQAAKDRLDLLSRGTQ